MSKNVNNDVTLNERLFNEDLSITNDDPRLKYIFTASKNHNGMKMSFRADMLCQENIKGFYVLLALLIPLLLSPFLSFRPFSERLIYQSKKFFPR